jgi:hypothetical protein
MRERLQKFIIFVALAAEMMLLLLAYALIIIGATVVFMGWVVKPSNGITKPQKKNS